ncbi:unnamed protein product [Porites evermanni]|uniref:Uncharacterized protein n=1 Tax=Porites evermanni TaxID=104178 RepID=A0ABN8RXK1_9CNID|nr:unnamed protein product [Porites evermanni]
MTMKTFSQQMLTYGPAQPPYRPSQPILVTIREHEIEINNSAISDLKPTPIFLTQLPKLLQKQHHALKYLKMKLLYPFITSSGYLREPPISLGLDLNPDCSNKKTANEKLKTLYSQMAVFKKPAYFAFSLEDGRGALHNSLANVLEMTSYSVNDTVSYVTRQMALKSLSVPALPKIPEAKLDERTRLYLSALVQSNSVTLTITDDIVKTYRNYVIMYVLYDVIKELGPCM